MMGDVSTLCASVSIHTAHYPTKSVPQSSFHCSQNSKNRNFSPFRCPGENEPLLQPNNPAMPISKHVRVALDDHHDADVCSVQLNVTGWWRQFASIGRSTR
ncbi:unnamed protein product [Sphagnum balticum]